MTQDTSSVRSVSTEDTSTGRHSSTNCINGSTLSNPLLEWLQIITKQYIVWDIFLLIRRKYSMN